MQTLDLTSLFLIPVGLSVAFMAWVFWNFGKERQKR